MMKYAQLKFYEFFRYDLRAEARIGGPEIKKSQVLLEYYF